MAMPKCPRLQYFKYIIHIKDVLYILYDNYYIYDFITDNVQYLNLEKM